MKHTCRKRMNAVFFLLAGLPGWALAAEASSMVPQRFDGWVRASDSELEQLRGGFVLPNGVNIDFSIASVSSINGTVVASSFFQLPEHVLFRNDAMNLAANLTGSGLSSIIQNSADNQVIRTMTEFNIAISNLKNMNLDNTPFALSHFISVGTH